ncbi:MAG: cupin domain-containing protein [Vicinamibacterales bacterium]
MSANRSPGEPRAAALIEKLALSPHPEGGHFREVDRSPARVQPLDGRAGRSALTTIYFLLAAGEVSRWHRVASDEVWHYYEGDPLELLSADASFDAVVRRMLGPVSDGVEPVHVVRAGDWQAARSTGSYTLVGCSVGPGFEFSDFELLAARPADVELVRGRHPELAEFV